MSTESEKDFEKVMTGIAAHVKREIYEVYVEKVRAYVEELKKERDESDAGYQALQDQGYETERKYNALRNRIESAPKVWLTEEQGVVFASASRRGSEDAKQVHAVPVEEPNEQVD